MFPQASNEMFATSAQIEEPEVDLVVSVLGRLQDGLKVSPADATSAMLQYRKFQVELGRLQSEKTRPSRSPKKTSTLYVQEKSYKDRTEKIITAKEKVISDLRQKLKETTIRLSALVGVHRSEADDKMSDLTDELKPAQISEDYRAVFDNEWLTAFEELRVGMSEAKVLIYLGKITWFSFEFAQEVAERQLTELMKREIEIMKIMCKPSYIEKERRQPVVGDGRPAMKFERDETLKLLKDYRRCLARTSVPGVKQIFMTVMARTPPYNKGFITEGVKKYIRRVIELTYLMFIQDPPMYLEWVRFGDFLDEEKFRRYTGSDGETIVGTLWPVVLMNKGGPVMSRGIVDVMDDKKGQQKSCIIRKYHVDC